MSQRQRQILAALPLLLALPAREAFPQDTSLDEIIVTAQRREQRLTDVPMSLSVFPAAELERRQITDVSSLQYAAPNLSVVRLAGSRNRVNIAMRGLVEPDRFPTVDPAVGVYLDGVYIARIAGANMDLIDMERVEVLRGPQGTLFGRNTIGGAINLVPRKPGPESEGVITAGVGNFERRELTGIFNLPFSSNAHAVRVAASLSEHDGYGRNVLLGEDVGGNETGFVRTQLRLAPADRTELNLSFDFTRIRADADRLTLVGAFAPLTQVPAARGNPDDQLANYVDPHARTLHANRAGEADSKTWGAAATLMHDFGRFTLQGSSSYRRLKTHDDGTDLDATPYDLLTILERDERQYQWSHELQAYNDSASGRLSWIGGLYFFKEHGTYAERFQALEPNTFISGDSLPGASIDHESLALYGQLTYALKPRLHLTAGVRYNEDRRQLTSANARSTNGIEACTLDPAVRDDPAICRATLPTRTFDYVPWNVGIDFTPVDDLLLYAKVSRGHRAGGYNMRGTTEFDLDTFEPEHVTAYEIGTRAAMFDRRLTFDLSLYQSEVDEVQLRQRVTVPGQLFSVALTGNAGEARVRGGELEVTGLLGRLRLAGSLGITKPEYTRLEPGVLGVQLDSEFLYTPESTASLTADLPLDFRFGQVDLHSDYSWRDDVPFAANPNSSARQPAYGLLNAMVTVRFKGTDLALRLWSRNLTNERYLVRVLDSTFLITAIPGDPRTFGASLTWRFGSAPSARNARNF